MLRHLDLGHLAEGTRVYQMACQSGRRRDFGRNEVDFRILRAGAALKVAVEGAQRNACGLRRLTHADAGAARTLENTRTGGNNVGKRTVLREHIEYLLGARADGQGNVRVNGLALEDSRDLHHIIVGRVGARADAALIYRNFTDFGDFLDVIRHMRHSGERLQSRKVYGVLLVVLGVRVGGQRYPYVAASLCLEELLRRLIGREDRGRRAQLRAHVGDGGAFRHGQGLNALACVLDDLADAAFDGHLAQNFQDNVLRGDPRRQLAGQGHTDHLRHRNVVRAAAHRDRNIQTARAERQHTDAAAGRGMAVRADEGLARCAEALEVYLMTDAVAGLGIVDAVLLCDGTDIFVVIRVFEAGLQGIMVNVRDRTLGLDLIDAHRLKLEISHRTGRILRQRLVDLEADFLPHDHLAVYQMRLQNFLRDCHTHVCVRSFLSRRRTPNAPCAPPSLLFSGQLLRLPQPSPRRTKQFSVPSS